MAAGSDSGAGAGVIGKVPGQRDFIRLNASTPLAQELFVWLEAGAQALRQSPPGADLPVTHFIFAPPKQRQLAVGVMVSSQDAVGRAFPLAVFASLPVVALGIGLAGLEVVAGPFLQAATAWVLEAGKLEPGSLGELAVKLPMPSEVMLSSAATAGSELLRGGSASGFLERLESSTGAVHYALRTFLSACQRARAAPETTRICLDCPAVGGLERSAWLELGRRALGNVPFQPSALWPSAGGRLLVWLGSAPPQHQMLLYLARPEHTAPTLWPLRTAQSAALAEAKQLLGPALDGLLSRSDLSLKSLLDALPS